MTKRSSFSEFDLVDSLTTHQILPAPYDPGPPVPNLFPRLNNLPYRIAIVGEAPGEAEQHHLIPFCPLPTPSNPKAGSSGRLLNEKLSHCNILHDACFIGNVCQYRPPNNEIESFARDGKEFTEGMEQLGRDLAAFNPNVCILLGKTALWAANGETKIGNWRGSFFVSSLAGPFLGRKCIATYHPAACLRQYEWMPLFFFDLKKALSEAMTPDLLLPQRELLYNLSYTELINELDAILVSKPELSMDIEGYWNNLQCISLAASPTRSILVPFTNMDGSSYWVDEEQEFQVWQRFIAIMSDPDILKCWQNGLYDRFVLQYGYNIVVYGCKDDTMLKFFEMYCELEKGLGFQNSILGKEPYYKHERKTNNRDTHFRYCCKDSATTYENNKRLDRLLTPQQVSHYKFNHNLLAALLYMECCGLQYDSALASRRLTSITHDICKIQNNLDLLAQKGLPPNSSKEELLKLVREKLCYKRNATQPKKGNEEAYQKCLTILQQTDTITTSDLGFVSIATNLSLNLKSPVFKQYLYETLSLPKQYKTDPETGVKRLTTDYEALLRLSKVSNHPSIQLALQLGVLRTRSQMLEIHADPDGRTRAGYNIVGTETGRLTCYTSPTGSGYNLQTIPKEDTTKPVDHPLRQGMRDLFTTDPDCYLFECDLSGADGWTVGAHLAMLGDSTMLDDLRAGLKPAQIVCYLLRHGTTSLTGRNRQEIKQLLTEIKKEDWDYFACKVGIWGTCFTMGPRKLATVFLTESEGALDWDEKKITIFQNAIKTRYRIALWHNWAQKQLRLKPELVAPNGFKRHFFGRYNEILGEYLAHLPQVITTYATNTALYKLWNDPENRVLLRRTINETPSQPIVSGDDKRTDRTTLQSLSLLLEAHALRVEPLHQVHDALVGQFKIADTAWAVGKIREWFNNPIIIAGQKITIPFSGSYGTNWSLDSSSEVGKI